MNKFDDGISGEIYKFEPTTGNKQQAAAIYAETR